MNVYFVVCGLAHHKSNSYGMSFLGFYHKETLKERALLGLNFYEMHNKLDIELRLLYLNIRFTIY